MAVALLFLASFTDIKKDGDLLLQVWTYERFKNETITYESHIKFPKNVHGMQFKENGVLKVKQNTGWCGTPPIQYETV